MGRASGNHRTQALCGVGLCLDNERPTAPDKGPNWQSPRENPRGPSLQQMGHLQMARGSSPESPPITGVPGFLPGVGLGCQKWGRGTVVSMATEKQVRAPWEEAGAVTGSPRGTVQVPTL